MYIRLRHWREPTLKLFRGNGTRTGKKLALTTLPVCIQYAVYHYLLSEVKHRKLPGISCAPWRLLGSTNHGANLCGVGYGRASESLKTALDFRLEPRNFAFGIQKRSEEATVLCSLYNSLYAEYVLRAQTQEIPHRTTRGARNKEQGVRNKEQEIRNKKQKPRMMKRSKPTPALACG